MLLLTLKLFLFFLLTPINSKSPALCSLPHGKGSTRTEAFYMFTFNSRIFECVPFMYSGSGGNDNRFWSKRDCEETCLASAESQ